MKVSREEVLHIARLARVNLAEEEIRRLSEELSRLLETFEVLQQGDTEGVPPTAQFGAVMRLYIKYRCLRLKAGVIIGA